MGPRFCSAFPGCCSLGQRGQHEAHTPPVLFQLPSQVHERPSGKSPSAGPLTGGVRCGYTDVSSSLSLLLILRRLQIETQAVPWPTYQLPLADPGQRFSPDPPGNHPSSRPLFPQFLPHHVCFPYPALNWYMEQQRFSTVLLTTYNPAAEWQVLVHSIPDNTGYCETFLAFANLVALNSTSWWFLPLRFSSFPFIFWPFRFLLLSYL